MLIHEHDPLQLAELTGYALLAPPITSQEEGQEAEEVAHPHDAEARGEIDPAEDVSWVGGEEDPDGAGVHAMAEDGDHEREVDEDTAGPATAAWEQQRQRRRGRLGCGAAQHPDPEGTYPGGLRVRQLDARQNEGGLDAREVVVVGYVVGCSAADRGEGVEERPSADQWDIIPDLLFGRAQRQRMRRLGVHGYPSQVRVGRDQQQRRLVPLL